MSFIESRSDKHRGASSILVRSVTRGDALRVRDASASTSPRPLAPVFLAACTALAIAALPARAVSAQASASKPSESGTQAAVPSSGNELLQRMHDRWATGTPWFHTLIFTQRTTVVRRDGTKNVSTWYESVQAPDRLRIDFGDPSEGNGVVYTADSVYVVRAGKVERKAADGNP